MATNTTQTTFAPREDRVRGVFRRASNHEFQKTLCASSGGADSTLAMYLAATHGPEYGIEPDAVVHAHTGIAAPQPRLVSKIMATVYGLSYIEANNGTVGPRVLKHGWPMVGRKGHFFERIERKEDVFDAIHAALSDEQLWISGARATESDERRMNVPDSGVEADGRRTRQTWASPCVGLTSDEKWEWIREAGLPVPETYLLLGFSGECLACAYDDAGIMDPLDLLAPNLAWAIRTLTAWLAMRGRGAVPEDLEDDFELTPKQLCWGWDPGADDTPDGTEQQTLDEDRAVENDWIGCSSESCSDAEVPEPVRNLPDWQIVDYQDVLAWERGDREQVIGRFA